MNEHTLKAFGDELEGLKAEIARMGGLVEAQLADAVAAVAKRDVRLAQQVIERDRKLDALQAEIEREAVRVIGLRQPADRQLRRAVAALKLSLALERAGDYAKNIAKRALVIAEAEPMTPMTRSIDRMGRLVGARITQALDAYAAGDAQRAQAIWAGDQEVDEHYEALFRELLTYMMSDPRTIQPAAHLLFVAKNLERIGDYATTVSEILYHEVTGEALEGERPKGGAPQATLPQGAGQ